MQRSEPYGIVLVMPGTDSQGKNSGNNYARYLYIGFTFILILCVLTAAGFFVDGLLGTLPLFLLLGLGAGFAGGMYYLYRVVGGMGGG